MVAVERKLMKVSDGVDRENRRLVLIEKSEKQTGTSYIVGRTAPGVSPEGGDVSTDKSSVYERREIAIEAFNNRESDKFDYS